MKHLPYENWILDETPLSKQESELLSNHLHTCKHCRQLKYGWEASRALLLHPRMVAPAPGFTTRWQSNLTRKCNISRVRRYRLTVASLLLLTFASALVYMVASGSFMQVLANFANTVIHSIISITNSLSTIGLWFNRVSPIIPITVGFLVFGLVNAFFLSAIFMVWNIRNKKQIIHETIAE